MAGSNDEETFQIKSHDLKTELEAVERQLDETDKFDPAFGEAVQTTVKRAK